MCVASEESKGVRLTDLAAGTLMMSPTSYVSLFILAASMGSTLVAGAAVRSSSCPPGWFFYRSHCYGFIRHPMSWSDAEVECYSYGQGTHLASILDDSEASIIGSHISFYQKKDGVWVGLHDPKKNGRWKWNDGSLYSYRAWKSGAPKPTKEKEYCAVLGAGTGFKRWKAAKCVAKKNFLCKYNP